MLRTWTRPTGSSSAAAVVFLLGLSSLVAPASGCALRTTRVGLVEEAPLAIRDTEGAVARLAVDRASAPLRYLGGCIVQVAGPRIAGRLVVREWRVLDAGDGSAGWLGVLREHGARLVLDDHNSGTTVVVDDALAPQLRPLLGHTVLLVGHVTGPNTVVPVAWRLLEPVSDPAP